MTETEEIRRELRRYLIKEEIMSATELEEAGKLLDRFYALASSMDEYIEGEDYAFALEKAAKKSGIFLVLRAKALYSGLYLAYYRRLKSLPEGAKNIQEVSSELQQDINNLAIKVISYFSALRPEEEPLLWVKYGLLQSLIESQLLFNTAKAQKINEKIKAKAIETGETGILLKEINTRGLAAEKAGNLEEAITIFGEAEKKFPDATDLPHARLDFANCMNNEAKCRILLSDLKDDPEDKLELLDFAIAGLLNASDIYKTVPPSPPVKHLEGIINRLIMAAFRVFNLYGFYHASDIIKRRFEMKKLEEAITEIREAVKVAEKHYMGEIGEINNILKGIGEAQKIIAEQKA